jgi:predicted O-methyltransferase YrrM
VCVDGNSEGRGRALSVGGRASIGTWIERLLAVVSLVFSEPRWAWNWIWFSPYNPLNRPHDHLKRLRDYERYEKPLVEMIQGACRVSADQADNILHDFQHITLHRTSDASVISPGYDATDDLARLCYSVVRLTAPSIVVETGVGRGVTSYYILRALEKNQKGVLYSVDLPPLKRGARQAVGQLVPPSLRSHWVLSFGPGIDEMQKLRSNLPEIDMFVHDSNHTYLNQLAEYRIAISWLKRRGMLISDDVGNDALLEVASESGCEVFVTRAKPSTYIGILRNLP